MITQVLSGLLPENFGIMTVLIKFLEINGIILTFNKP